MNSAYNKHPLSSPLWRESSSYPYGNKLFDRDPFVKAMVSFNRIPFPYLARVNTRLLIRPAMLKLDAIVDKLFFIAGAFDCRFLHGFV